MKSRIWLMLAALLAAPYAVVLAAPEIAVTPAASLPEPPTDVAQAAKVDLRWGVKIPLRDGVRLNATLYTPRDQQASAPCVFTLTPYISANYHDRGVYFAAHGYPFLTVDARGRGNSEGEFRPLIQEAQDGYDVVEWLARQPYCNGKVTMWGGSYAGYNQWATAKEFPPHLATIVPVASPYAAVDFPARNNIFSGYNVQWLNFTSGKTSQLGIFGDEAFWKSRYRRWYLSGAAFKTFDSMFGQPQESFQEWIAHPHRDAYWDSYNPSSAEYARLELPILTITGSYDGDQPGALEHYREHMKHTTPAGRERHFLVIGPWDHAGTRTPRAEVGGLTFGPASLVDLPRLHLDWYAWTMQNGPRPKFLEKNVAYYVMGAERWRYADTLEAVTSERRAWYLDSSGSADSVFGSGSLSADGAGRGAPDSYRYDPRDLSPAEVESASSPQSLIDQRLIYAQSGKQLVYHSEPFAQDVEISGFFELSAWIAIDQPDTDFSASVYEILADGRSILLSNDLLRARYRESAREPKLIRTKAPLRYDFERFMFVSRLVSRGSRLRLVIAPVNSMYQQKNYNTGGEVSEETIEDARTVVVTLYHDRSRPSALYVPIGQPERAAMHE